MAERGLLNDVKSRHLPAVNLGPQITLQEKAKFDYDTRFANLISKDGHAHLFAIDKEKRIHHIEISGNEVLNRELLGEVDKSYPNPKVDTVEHPRGKLRVLAGDKMFIRSEGGKWQEIEGNRCQRFIAAGDDLLCTFIAKGQDLGAPKRKDWLVGWFVLIPVVLWSDVHAEKLVIAKETPAGWTITAVVDPESELSARSDYVMGADSRGLQLLYRSSGGSYMFIVGFAGGAGAIGGTDVSDQQISYARVDYEMLFQRPSDSDPASNNNSAGWLRVAGKPISTPPFVDRNYSNFFWRDSLDRRFTVNGASGKIEGLVWVDQFIMNDGVRKIDGTGITEHHWAEVKISEDRWIPNFDIVAAENLPEPDYKWGSDWGALIRSDAHGNDHALLIRVKPGFWKASFEICYFIKTAVGWSAPVVLGHGLSAFSPRGLALDGNGKALAIWVDRNNTVKARWIQDQKNSPGENSAHLN